MLDWDRVRVFRGVAQAGSFTRAADSLGLSQSAISRQIGALEEDVGTPLFHRHARGLVLTEQGEMLFRTAHDVLMKLEAIKTRLKEAKDRPSGVLKVTTTVGLGAGWLTQRLHEFTELYPEISLQLILANEELDLTMRQADCAIRLRQPQQPDLIQRRLFTVHFHLYASPLYIERFGLPETIEELDQHRLITFGEAGPSYLRQMNWVEIAGRKPDQPRAPALQVNSITAIARVVRTGGGIALLPDYLIEPDSGLVRIIPDAELPTYETYFVYPAELKTSARVKAFRDFLIARAEAWPY
jgi:DNA-binding transcriptional LysR family regulator